MSIMTHIVKDTTAVSGIDGPAPEGTASEFDNVGTDGAVGGSRTTEGASPNSLDLATDGALGGATTVPTPTPVAGVIDTLQPGQIGAGNADPVYRAPAGPIQGTTLDTSRTDIESAGAITNPVTSGYAMTETQAVADIGATGSGTGATPPVAPTSVTLATGPRYITVTWVAPAQITDDPTLGFVIINSAGGVTFAPGNATSVQATNVVPGRDYTFQVAARNKAGVGPLSTASAAESAYNPDVLDDPQNPGGLDPYQRVNPIYSPAGAIKAGTARNNAPVIGALTPGTQASKQITVNWTAPTFGDVPTSFVVRASDGTNTTSAAGTTSKVVTFTAGGGTVFFTLQAVNLTGLGAVSPASATALVPGGLNNAPAIGAVVAGAEDSLTITINWTAPTVGDLATGFNILASNGTATTSAAGTTSKDVLFDIADVGDSVTFTVAAVNGVGTGPVSAASAAETIP